MVVCAVLGKQIGQENVADSCTIHGRVFKKNGIGPLTWLVCLVFSFENTNCGVSKKAHIVVGEECVLGYIRPVRILLALKA